MTVWWRIVRYDGRHFIVKPGAWYSMTDGQRSLTDVICLCDTDEGARDMYSKLPFDARWGDPPDPPDSPSPPRATDKTAYQRLMEIRFTSGTSEKWESFKMKTGEDHE